MTVTASERPDPVFVLSVGTIFGGPEQNSWRQPLRELTRRVALLRSGVDSPLNLNVVFHVPGSVIAPDYRGLRTGSFRRKDSLLMVQVALPPEVPGDAGAFLRAAMVAAVDEAMLWASRKRKSIDLSNLRALAERV